MKYWHKSSLLFILVILSLSCRDREPTAIADGSSITMAECVPSFRLVSEEYLHSNLAHWPVEFGAALVGCEEDINKISDPELEEIAKYLQIPSEWTRVLLPSMPQDLRKDERTALISKVNDLLKNSSISDVHFFCISLSETI